MVLALTTEHAWDFGLMGLNILVLLIGIPAARAFATSNNATFRFIWPAFALGILATFAIFVYFARMHVK